MNMGFDGCSEKQWHYHVTGSCHGTTRWCPYCYIEQLASLVRDPIALLELRNSALNTKGALQYLGSIDRDNNPIMAEKIKAKLGLVESQRTVKPTDCK